MRVLVLKNETELFNVGTENRSRNGTAFSDVKNNVDYRNLVEIILIYYCNNKITTIKEDVEKDDRNGLKKTLTTIISTGDKHRINYDSANAFDFYKAKELIELGQNKTKQALENTNIIGVNYGC
ncbi:MAG: hypothetical protein ACP5DQ_08590 [Bacteroidales bacterium]